jgi:hypothetical protein
MILVLCQAIIHQRQPTRSYTQTFRRFLGVVYIVLGPLSNVIHIYTIFQYSPTSRGHRLPTGVDQFPHPKSSADYISASSTSSYAHSQDFAMYPLSILHPFGFSIHARVSNRKPPLDGRHLCSYQPTTHSPTYDRNVSPVGTRSQAGSQVRTINLKAGCPFMSTVVVLLIVFQIAEQLIRLMTGGPQFSRCSHSPRLPSDSPFLNIHTPILGLCSGSLAHTYSLDTSFMSL